MDKLSGVAFGTARNQIRLLPQHSIASEFDETHQIAFLLHHHFADYRRQLNYTLINDHSNVRSHNCRCNGLFFGLVLTFLTSATKTL